MGLRQTLSNWFGSPADVMDRSLATDLDLRANIGSIVVPPSQMNKAIWTTGNPNRYVSEGWSKAPVVFACVMAIADAVATAPLRVLETTGEDEPMPADDSPLGDLMQRPNPDMDGAEFINAVVAIAALAGFCVVEKERNGFDDVVALWPLRSDWLKPIPRSQSAPAWEYRIPGYRDPEILEPEDVIVYTHAPDPNRGYQGTAPMAIAFRELGIENAMTDFLKAFFDRGALPVYGIVTDYDFKTQEEADAYRHRLMGKYGGAQRAGEPMLMGSVKDVKRIGFDFDELAYPELRALSETQICTAFRVPPILIGVQAGLDAGTYSNYEQARRAFFEDTVTSLWRRLDGALSRSLVPEFDDTGALSIDFDRGEVPALRDDENTLWQRTTAALSAGGISTHTYQKLLGLDTHGPDVIYQPFSATPVPVTQGGQRSASYAPYVEVSNADLALRVMEEMAPAIAKALQTGELNRTHDSPYEVRDGRTYLRLDVLPEHERSRHTRAAQHNRDMIGKFSQMLEPRMAAFFAEQGERIVGQVTGERSAFVHAVTKDESFRERGFGPMKPEYYGLVGKRALEDWQWQDELDRLRSLIEQWFGEVGAAMFAELAAQLDSDIAWTGGNQYIAELYEQLGTRIVGIHETTRTQVERVIVDGLTEGKSIPQLADDLRGLFQETYKGRATTVARTESQFAANTSAGAAYAQSGIERAVLYDNPQHDTDPGSDGLTCAERNGLVIPVGRIPFHSGGTHPNCTMAVGPVVEG